MCIRDRVKDIIPPTINHFTDDPELDPKLNFTFNKAQHRTVNACLLYTSDAADERSSVDLGGRRIIKKKNSYINKCSTNINKQNKEHNQRNGYRKQREKEE